MRVLHVVASAQRRGAEMFAADLVRALPSGSADQRVAILRCTEDSSIDYEAPTTVLAAASRETFLDPGALASLHRLVRTWRPHVVLSHGGEALKYSVAAARSRSVVVYRRIGSSHPRTSSGLRRTAYGWLIRRASRVVAVADAVRTETIRVFRVREERVVTICNAIDMARLRTERSRDEVRESMGISPGIETVLSVGAFTWEKDPLAQLDIASSVLRVRPNTVFLMVGDGPLRSEVETALRRSSLDGSVRLLGVRANVAETLTAADVLLLTSQTEGMPAALIEAGAVGVPAAAYSVGGVPEVVEHGQTGLLAESGDARGLAACVLDLLGSETSRAVMGRAASERCRSRFDIHTIATQYVELFQELQEHADSSASAQMTRADGPRQGQMS
jgi:glycosyltransferase involved in cell wall biosynthesis